MANARARTLTRVALCVSPMASIGCEASTVVDLLPDAGYDSAVDNPALDAGYGGGGNEVEATGGGGGGNEVVSDGGGGANGSGGASSVDASAMCQASSVESTDATALVSDLIHRYDFSGTGTLLCDRAGDSPGSIEGGAVLEGSGTLSLDGKDDYVTLPAGMVSGWTSVTIVVWFTWRWSRAWERIFDFGAEEMGEAGLQSKSHFFYTPRYVPGPESSANIFDGKDMLAANGKTEIPTDAEQQIAVVFPGGEGLISTYLNGVLDGTQQNSAAPPPLSELLDQNCWLGRSQQSWDPYFAGAYNEFRIYSRALTEAEIAVLFEAGPDRP